MKQVELKGQTYTWDGVRRLLAGEDTVPPVSVVHRLNATLSAELSVGDAPVTDPDELIRRAQAAEKAGQLSRALRLARRAYEQDRQHEGRAAYLCGLLRRAHHPDEAILVPRGSARPDTCLC